MPQVRAEDIGERLLALPGVAAVRARLRDGDRVYLVGGAVRDLLLGREDGDLDLVVEGDAAALAARIGEVVRAHGRFGTATVRVEGRQMDVATARSETYERPGSLPLVQPADLAADLARRDFTVNAMALQLDRPRLIDPHDGVADLQRGILRVLHEASLRDDPTRALRGARYAARLGLEPDSATRELIAGADLTTVSRERVEAELRRSAQDEDPAAAFRLMAAWGVIELDDERLRLIERITALGGPWRSGGARTDAIVALARRRTGEAEALAAQSPASASEAVQAAHGRTEAELVLARAMGADWLDRYVQEWRSVRPEISGRDLLAAGVVQGPAVGRGLRAALAAKLDGGAPTRDHELAIALAAARGPHEPGA